MQKRLLSLLFADSFFSHSTEKVRTWSLPCFRNSRYQKTYGSWGWGITIFRRIIEVKVCSWMLGYPPVCSASEHSFSTYSAMGSIGISDYWQWNHDIYKAWQKFELGPARWETFFLNSLPRLFFWKIICKNTLTKIRNKTLLFWMDNFSRVFIFMRRKTAKQLSDRRA